MKKFLALFLAACVLLTMVACSGDQGGNGTTNPPAQTTAPNDATSAPTDPTNATNATDPTDPQATEPPVTTVPPATEPPATNPPATNPPATNPPATEPPVTAPPATEPPVTEPEVTEPAVPAESILKGTPTIDGKLDNIYLPSYRVVVDHTMGFNVPVASPDKIQAKVYFLHDGESIYVCAVVTGDSAVVDTGLVSWVADAVEIWFSNPAGDSSKIVMDAFATPWPHNATNNLENKLKIKLTDVEMAAVRRDGGYTVEMKVAIPYYRKSEGSVAINVQLNNVYAADSDASNWDIRNGGCYGTQPAKHEPMVVFLSAESSV